MFYKTWVWKEQTEPFTPKGPNLSRLKRHKLKLDGSVIEICSPRHRSPHRESKVLKGNIALCADSVLHRGPFGDNWKCIHPVTQQWEFYGPLGTGSCGIVTLSFYLLTYTKHKKGVSYFNPRAFEFAITQFLTESFGDWEKNVGNDTQCYFAPLNWRVLEEFGVPAARFDMDISDETRSTHFLMFPVSPDFLAMARIEISRVPNTQWKRYPKLDDFVRPDEMFALRDLVFDNITLTLSPEAQTQQKAALEGLDDTELVKSFPPIQWLPLDDEGKKKLLLT
ncbi:hypothetical protein [Marinibactrum halimedae]|uniref:Uncharacterized protein n=1 Tax=Marinibactrum halimedae TaxID=1444977 RepID=A0AA37WMU1_9GAMM|nr:hypothetical protein [Marinibactrum halimedae]MCD9459711.1 hypothetical protein [Marinibactrum halimedae]GLS24532.1 hypothetical protein GCM10007877_02440 [Marinibactrum halimedae]